MTEYTERELILPALALLDQHAAGLTTSDLIRELTAILEPDGHDDEILAGRNDTYFSQKVRNLVSHRTFGGTRTRDLRRRPAAPHDHFRWPWLPSRSARSSRQTPQVGPAGTNRPASRVTKSALQRIECPDRLTRRLPWLHLHLAGLGPLGPQLEDDRLMVLGMCPLRGYDL